jgi:hypothetical protein
VGNDIYQSPLPGLGDYVLVRVTHHAAPVAAAGVSPAREALRTLPWVLGGLLAAFLPAILAVRLRRRSR